MKNKSIACCLSRVTRLEICHVLGNGPVLSGAEQYFSRNLSEVRVRLNECRRNLLIVPLWDIRRGPQTFQYNSDNIDHLFRFFSFSLVAKLATIFRIKSPVPKFESSWRLQWSQL